MSSTLEIRSWFVEQKASPSVIRALNEAQVDLVSGGTRDPSLIAPEKDYESCKKALPNGIQTQERGLCIKYTCLERTHISSIGTLVMIKFAWLLIYDSVSGAH
jgi:hypothetical protein